MSDRDYKVTEFLSATAKDGKYGAMKSVKMRLEGVEGVVDWYTKAQTPDPQAGDTLNGAVSDGKYGWQFKKAQPQGNFGGGGPRPEDPVRSARILRQHSQHMAIESLKLAAQLGVVDKLPPVESVGDLVGLVKTLSDAYDGDVVTVAAQTALTPEAALRRSEGAM